MSESCHPKLFGVCFAKNEEDIIADSVTYAAQFCNKVFIVDNASTDRTWKIVKGLDLKNLAPVCSKDFVFRDYLRLRFMDAKKEELGLDNWWYIFDADEFLLDDPCDVITLAEEEGADCIAVKVINFLLTEQEVRDAEENGRLETWRDRRWYVLYETGPIKLFKNTKYIDYSICNNIPFGLMKECSLRVFMRHYPHRSIGQLKKRVYTRYGNVEFESECKRGTALEGYVIDPNTLPEIWYWDGEEGLDLGGRFSINVPRIGESLCEHLFVAVIRALYHIRLLREFYALYRRYAAWRQEVDLENEPSF